MVIMVTNNNYYAVDCEPDFLVDDSSFMKIMSSDNIRLSLLKDCSRESVAIGRLGISHSDLFVTHSDQFIEHVDVSKRFRCIKELGYYAKL